MTPDLMRAGSEARRHAEKRAVAADRGQHLRRPRRQLLAPRHAPASVDITHGAILYLEDISVSFDGFKALNALSMSISAGELRCIIGPNGAGKTTMMDVITGKTRPDSGRCFFGSTIDLLRLRENEIASVGVGRKFQKPTVFEYLSVFENLELALKADRGVRASLFFRLSGAQLDRIGEMLTLDPPEGPCPAHRRHALARPEAVARDRHAADAEPAPAAARRARRRHDRRGNRAHGRAVPVARGQPLAGRRRARHELHPRAHARQPGQEGHRAARRQRPRRRLAEAQVQSDEKVVEVYLGR